MSGLHIMYYQNQFISLTGATLPKGMISGVQMMNMTTLCSSRVCIDSQYMIDNDIWSMPISIDDAIWHDPDEWTKTFGFYVDGGRPHAPQSEDEDRY